MLTATITVNEQDSVVATKLRWQHSPNATARERHQAAQIAAALVRAAEHTALNDPNILSTTILSKTPT